MTFTTIYPGWYQGRATHIHLEVTINGVSRKVTQIAFPESVNNTVYRSGVYASRGSNPMSNLSDGIFADSLSCRARHAVGRCCKRLYGKLPGRRIAVASALIC